MSTDALHDARNDAVAARAGKTERLLQGNADLVFEGCSKQSLGAKQTAAHRRLRYAQALGRFFDRHLFHFAHDEHGTEADRELVYLFLDQSSQFDTHHCFLWRSGRRIDFCLIFESALSRVIRTECDDDLFPSLLAESAK